MADRLKTPIWRKTAVRFFVVFALSAAVTSVAAGADDIPHVRDAPVGPSMIGDQLASMEADAILIKEQKRILVDGHLHYSGGFSLSEPSIQHLWVVFPDRIAELTPVPIIQDGMRYLEFNASYAGAYPRGTVVDIVGEFTFKGGETKRIRVAHRCLDLTLSAPLEPGESDCNP